MSGIFKVSKVYDPRVNLSNSIIRGDESIDLTIEQGSSSVQYFQENASSAANNQITWTNINWSPALGLGRFVYISVPVTFTFTAEGNQINKNGIGQGFLTSSMDAPRSHFMRCVTSSSVSFGNITCNETPAQYISALSWYNKKGFDPKTSFGFSHILDNNVIYNPSVNNNVLGSYGNNGIYGSEGRGAYEGVYFKYGTTTVGLNPDLYYNASSNTTVQKAYVLFNEPLYVSPFMLSGDEKFGSPIIGINNGFSITLTLNPLPGLLWSHAAEPLSGVNILSTNVELNDGNNIYGLLPTFHYQLFTIPKSISPDPIHLNTIIQYNSTKIIRQSFGNLAIGESNILPFNNFTPVSVPKMIYVFVSEADTEADITKPFNFMNIQNINVTFGNNQNILANVVIKNKTDINTDLFQIICQKNGLQMTAPQFSKFVGSVVAIDPAEDLNLDDWVSGESNLTNLQVTVTFKNNTGRAVNNLYGTLVTIQEGAILYNGTSGTFSQIVNLVNPQFIKTDLIKTNASYYYQKDGENYLGGLSLSSLIRHIPYIGPLYDDAKDIAKTVAKYTHKAIPYVKEALPYIEDFTKKYDEEEEGSGVIGGKKKKGKGVIGGKKMKKASLYEKMLEY